MRALISSRVFLLKAKKGNQEGCTRWPRMPRRSRHWRDSVLENGTRRMKLKLRCSKAPPGFRDVPNLTPLQPRVSSLHLVPSLSFYLHIAVLFGPLFDFYFGKLWLTISFTPETCCIATFLLYQTDICS